MKDASPRLRIEGLRSALAGPFDLAVPPGTCAAITGPSGSGKSLFLRMVADLDPAEGRVWLDGRERQDFVAPEWRRQVMYVPAEPGWWSERAEDHFPPDTLADARALAPALGLQPGQLAGPVARLSTGERQRLALIRALSRRPLVLLLDEPTGALDQETTALVECVLRDRLGTGVAMLIVTHSVEQAARLGTAQRRMSARRFMEFA